MQYKAEPEHHLCHFALELVPLVGCFCLPPTIRASSTMGTPLVQDMSMLSILLTITFHFEMKADNKSGLKVAMLYYNSSMSRRYMLFLSGILRWSHWLVAAALVVFFPLSCLPYTVSFRLFHHCVNSLLNVFSLIVEKLVLLILNHFFKALGFLMLGRWLVALEILQSRILNKECIRHKNSIHTWCLDLSNASQCWTRFSQSSLYPFYLTTAW